jgi:branched-chain amino acid aminotransferase
MSDEPDFSRGAAFCDDRFMPVAEAKISILDWGFTRSDVAYDVVHVHKGAFFRLADHLDRFERSLKAFRLVPPFDRAQIATIAARCVVSSGLREAYVAMVCTRGRPRVAGSRKPADCDNTFISYAIPWIDVIPLEVQSRGAHLWIAGTPRFPAASIDPTAKNYHWGDLTKGLLEAHDAGADTAVLLDADGYVTEGPGFNIFIVRDGQVLSPDRGALEGITRRSVLDGCESAGIPAKIAPLRAEDLLNADEAFCTTTAGGVMPASRVNDRILANDRPGPITMRVRELYWAQHQDSKYVTQLNYRSFERPFEL